MSFPIAQVQIKDFPPLLHEIPQPPTSLNYRGALPPSNLKLLSIVGSRNYTSYGKEVIDKLLTGLKNYPVGIVSGLALGIDSLAHEAALKNNLYTLAIPGGGLADASIYPARHKSLAHDILEAGGGLLSEFEPDFKATAWSFPKRNRLVAGISHATLLIEAAEKSGTLITARMATDYNRELLVVPGSIFSKNSYGIHQFLKLGATPVTTAGDILDVFGIDPTAATEVSTAITLTKSEQIIIDALHEPLTKDDLLRTLDLSASEANQVLMLLELQGHIVYSDGKYRPSL